MPPPPHFQYDVFLSHNAKDKPRVRRLAERLKQAGLQVWFDEWKIPKVEGKRMKDESELRPSSFIPHPLLDEGLEQSRVLLLCISPDALASGWVALERSTAVHRDPANAGRRFIPLLLGDCGLPDTLRRYKYVDFREESETAFGQLLTACRPDTETTPAQARPRKRHQSGPKKNHVEQLAVLERQITEHWHWVRSVAVSADAKWAVTGGTDRTVKIWNLGTGKGRGMLDVHEHPVSLIALTPDNTRILSATVDGRIHVSNSITKRRLQTLEAYDGEILALAGLADGKRVLSGSRDGTVRLWHLKSSSSTVLPRVDYGRLSCIAFIPDGQTALEGQDDGKLWLRDLTTGRRIAALRGHTDRIWSAQVGLNSEYAVTASEDETLRIWDLKKHSCRAILEGHTSGVRSVAIGKDGTLIASAGFSECSVRLWQASTGFCLQIIELPALHFPLSLAFSPDGRRLIVTTTFNSFLVFSIAGRLAEPSKTATRRYVNAKVVLLGEGMVGKTSLAHRLIKDEFVICARTHGMNVWPLILPLSPDTSLEREALLWDLAGQEDSRLIHQLFLEETSLALLLINAQNTDPFAEAGEWLKALKTAANNLGAKREAARLLIFSQMDVGGMKLSSAKIERFCEQHGFADWLATGAESGKNCSDKENGDKPSKVKQLIAASIPWDELPWTSTPRLLAELKNAVMAMRDESDIRLLRFSELAQRLEQTLPGEKFAEPDVRTAVTLLANHGLARPLKFGDLVLLRPDLINGYAGAVIRAARAHTDEIGCVPEADIYRPDFDFTGVERLAHRPDEELLLRALVQTFLDHSLCIAEDTAHGRLLVFPSQYRREKDIPHEPDIFVSYTFSGEWQTVWTTLVVRLWYSQEFAHRELWRNAAEFESARKQTLGLKITKTGDGAATISLYFDAKVEDVLKVIFIEYVHRHLARYACEVTRDRRYVCPECGKLVKDLDAVRRRLEAKKDFITCQECDERVPFIDFIEQRLKSDPVARKILAMDATATRELDTQALEQILIGHMMAIAGEANQIFRPVTMFDHGIDGEVEFKDDDGKASGKRIYIQLKSGNSYLRTRKGDGSEVFNVKDERHLSYWVSQPVDVYLVIRQTDEASGGQTIRWMNVTRYLTERKDKTSRQIIFNGEKLDMEAVWKVRDGFFPPK